MESVGLREWTNTHSVGEEMVWKGAAGHQLRFVSNTLATLFGRGLKFDHIEQLVFVISTHMSKSIVLPVYHLRRPDVELQIVLRNNFHNWKLSVLSDEPIVADFSGLFHTTPPVEPDYTGDPLDSVYFEGFPKRLIFGYLSKSDGRVWSAEIFDDESLWTTLYLIMRSRGLVQPFKWHTKESHRKELEAE